MQNGLLSLLIVIAYVGGATGSQANAADYPVCLFGGASDQMNCGFVSVEQCQATASGGLGYCAANPALGFALALHGRATPHRR
jgi:Protein of unknown function (DUF3551)